MRGDLTVSEMSKQRKEDFRRCFLNFSTKVFEMARVKSITAKSFIKDVQLAITMDSVKRIYKPYLKTFTEEAMLTIPTTGSGLTAKKTVVTTGRPKPPAGRAEARMAQLKLSRRRKGNSEADRNKAIATALNKIERMKDERLARIVQRKGVILRIPFGTFYAPWIAPRYDTARQKLPKVVRGSSQVETSQTLTSRSLMIALIVGKISKSSLLRPCFRCSFSTFLFSTLSSLVGILIS